MNNNIAAVILVSNEIYWLPYVLETVRGLFGRYVIYDIGSTDGTIDVIQKFHKEEEGKVEFYIRYLPMLDPDIQGIFRNSMIAEAKRDWYFILDGDELYKRQELNSFLQDFDPTEKKIYGVGKRYEFNLDITKRYETIRSHHRLYHRSAIWKGTHPGEEPCTQQKSTTEFNIDLLTYHMHNTLRTPDEQQVPGRIKRKSQKSYHPGDKLIDIKILDELPLLRRNLGFPVCPALEKLQNEFNNG